jgi:hypothetical protein
MGQEVAQSLNLSALANGLYLVELHTNQGTFTSKVVKD